MAVYIFDNEGKHSKVNSLQSNLKSGAFLIDIFLQMQFFNFIKLFYNTT